MSSNHKKVGTITKGDWELLRLIDSFKILTVSQLSTLSQRSRQVVRRRLRLLTEHEIISIIHRAYGNKRGRPEDLIQMTQSGQNTLHGNKNAKSLCLWNDQSVTPHMVNHELLVNWVLIQLIQVERQLQDLTLKYFTRYYSSVEQRHPKPSTVKIKLRNDQGEIDFIPDAVFVISNAESKKALLFFLEVDMGTETISSPKRGAQDIRQKIINYQGLFRSCHYKVYENYFKCRLNGFRLLFVANSQSRLIALCRLAKSMPPSDFIWLTDQDSIIKSGISGKIWSRGGKYDVPSESILGCKLPHKAATK